MKGIKGHKVLYNKNFIKVPFAEMFLAEMTLDEMTLDEMTLKASSSNDS
jgi:hypothetical protein